MIKWIILTDIICNLRWFKVPNKRIKSNKKIENERAEPEVILDSEYDDNGILYIIIENIGLSSAYKVSIKFDKEITGIEGEKKYLLWRYLIGLYYLSHLFIL